MHTCTHAGGDGKDQSDDEGSSSDSTGDSDGSDGSSSDEENDEEERVLPSRGTYACLLIFNHILTCIIDHSRSNPPVLL